MLWAAYSNQQTNSCVWASFSTFACCGKMLKTAMRKKVTPPPHSHGGLGYWLITLWGLSSQPALSLDKGPLTHYLSEHLLVFLNSSEVSLENSFSLASELISNNVRALTIKAVSPVFRNGELKMNTSKQLSLRSSPWVVTQLF
jgi:hypothetical protein